ncbi:TM2 domain-containing protein [Deinococcus sp.]|uniref:TM2 domain-containing protein n=1 Tax=Deinococcus sp. TaxID=47478 RepID=UPI0025C210A6|nr:TM2 domain-containing protein [Deinococcus sp.]
MTKPERPDDLTPQGNMPTWIDEVLKPAPQPSGAAQTPLSGPQDLKIPPASQPSPTSQRPPAPPAPSNWETSQRQAQAQAQTQAQAQPLQQPQAAPYAQPTVQTNAWGEPVASAPYTAGPHNPAQPNQPLYISPDVAQKRLIAGLLGIFLGGFGIHKFYLGITNPGLIMLAITIGAYIFGVLTMIFGIGFLIVFLPSLVGLLGFVEGIVYLTKSDADFQRDYLDGKKPWL